MDALLKAFMSDAKATLQNHGGAFQNLKNQVGQIATALTQRPSAALASTTEASTSRGNEQLKAISLRSGKDLTGPSTVSGDGNVEKEKKQKNRKTEKEKNSFDAIAPNTVTSETAPVSTPKLVPEYTPTVSTEVEEGS